MVLLLPSSLIILTLSSVALKTNPMMVCDDVGSGAVIVRLSISKIAFVLLFCFGLVWFGLFCFVLFCFVLFCFVCFLFVLFCFALYC